MLWKILIRFSYNIFNALTNGYLWICISKYDNEILRNHKVTMLISYPILILLVE